MIFLLVSQNENPIISLVNSFSQKSPTSIVFFRKIVLTFLFNKNFFCLTLFTRFYFLAIQLSIFGRKQTAFFFPQGAQPRGLVGSSGLEPPTSRLSGVCSNQLSYEPVDGGGKRIRTDDPLLAGQVLYQLSYTPIYINACVCRR